jgi:hypothetical protein
MAFTLGTRGIYWDEYVQSWYGRHVLLWFTSGFTDRSAMEQGNLYLYGGLVEATLELGASVLPLDRYLVRHALVAATALLGLYGVYRLGSELGSEWTGAVAAVLLAASPRFFGHGFFNSKDLPFAVLYLWVLVLLVRDLKRPLGAPLRAVVPLALVLGMLLGTRIGGAIICAPILLAYAARWWTADRSRAQLVLLAARFSVVFTVAWAVMLVAWPWAQTRPFIHPLAALLVSGRFPWPYDQLYEGRWVSSLELPLDYLPTWLLRTTPEIVLLGLALFLVFLLARPSGLRALRRPGLLGVTVAGVLPLVYVIATRAALYDGPRHILFLQPLIALAAASGLVAAVDFLREKRAAKRLAAAAVLVVAAGVALPVASMLSLRPLEYVYFNHASGGLAAAEGRFELDYWGLSYRLGVEWVQQNVTRPGGVRLAGCSHPGVTEPFVREPVRFVGTPIFGLDDDPDVLLYTALHDCVEEPPAEAPDGRVVHTIRRQGVPVLTVFEVERIPDSWIEDEEAGG